MKHSNIQKVMESVISRQHSVIKKRKFYWTEEARQLKVVCVVCKARN